MSAHRPVKISSVAVILVATAIAAASPAAFAAPATCTINGSRGNDVLRGTPGNDVICGLGGNDTIIAGGGNDVIRGGDGNDRIAGDAGNDLISGGNGNDTINSGAGNDRASGEAGNDFVDGSTGNDFTGGDSGNDQVAGGAGDDALQGGTGTDRIVPGAGDDTCSVDRSDRLVGECVVDRSGPQIAWIDRPTTVTAGTTFRATLSIKDPSGIDPNSPNGKIGGAPGWITSWCGFTIPATLVSGTNSDGVWEITCAVPANAVNDPYSIWVSAQDSFGNPAFIDNTGFTVVGGSTDNQAPAISDVVIPTTAQPGETITLTWRAADPSGVRDVPFPWVYVPRPGINGLAVLYGDGVIETPIRTSGTATDGSYSQRITIPEGAPAGTYAVYISVRDELGNKTYEQHGSFTVG